MVKHLEKYVWSFLRIGLGWIFLWAFMDKLFGFGFSTVKGKGWLDGVSPTYGFLANATKGPLAFIYKSIAGNVLVDWVYMLGLLLIGLALILGIGLKIAGYSGALMMALFFSAALPPLHNPLLDEHIIYILVLLGLTVADSSFLSLKNRWQSAKLVKKYGFLA